MTTPLPLVKERGKTITVESIDDGVIHLSDHLSFYWDEESSGSLPVVGDILTMWGAFGRPIRGIAVNGDLRWYQTEEEWQIEAKKKQEAKDRQERIDFALTPNDFAARILALPDPFRRRMEKFIGTKDEFLRRFGSYEMSVVEDAVKIAAWFKEQPGDPDDAWTRLREDHSISKTLGCYDGHSGNSWGMAMRLGYYGALLDEHVELEHGALVALVGCEEYGCPHPWPVE